MFPFSMIQTDRPARRPVASLPVVAIAAALLSLVGAPEAARCTDCANTSTGSVPINDLGIGYYRGVQGGLYTGGTNTMPAAHLTAGVYESGGVMPRNSAGQPDAVNGRIVLLTIGMSNCSYESDAFVSLAMNDPLKNPKVIVVNGAQPNQTAEEIDDPNAPFWGVVNQRLAAQGLGVRQVQAIWFKETNAFPTEPFPLFPNVLNNQFNTIMRIIRDRYTKTRLAYCSSRTYGGYATIGLNPEPYAYESGFAVKWLIKDQMDGDPALNFSASKGVVEAPWIAWGPYLWADGLTPRSDGLIWECDDFWESDGTHPTASGTAKVAQRLLAFFQSDPTTRNWYLANPPTDVAAGDGRESESSEALARGVIVRSPRPNPFNPLVTIPVEVRERASVRVDVVSIAGRLVATLVDGELAAGVHNLTWDGRDASGASAASGTYLLRAESNQRVTASQKLNLVR